MNARRQQLQRREPAQQYNIDRLDGSGSDDNFDARAPQINNLFGVPDQNHNNDDGHQELDDFVFGNQNDTSMGIGSNSNQGGISKSREAASLDFFAQTQGGGVGGGIQQRQGAGGQDRRQNIKINVSNVSTQQKVSPNQAGLKGQNLMGFVNKLSNWGLSQHERFLKLNKKGLAYFSEKPPGQDTGYQNVEAIEALKKDYKPKYCIPLDAIIEVAEITEEERLKHKKFFKDESINAFKVVFIEKDAKKKVDLVPESPSESLAQLDLDGNIEERKDSASTKGLKTWYFSMDPTKLQQQTSKSWMTNISIYAKRTNKNFRIDPKINEILKKELKKKQQSNDYRQPALSPAQNGSDMPTYEESKDQNHINNMNQMQQNHHLQQQQQHHQDDQFQDDQDNLNHGHAQEENNQKNALQRRNSDRLKRFHEVENQPEDDENDNKGNEGGKKEGKVQTEDEQLSLGKWTNKNVKSARQHQQGKQMQNRPTMPEEDRRNMDQNIQRFAKSGNEYQERKQKQEDQGWDLKFQKLVDYVINAENDMTRNFKLSQRMFDHICKFRDKVRAEVVKIVEDLDKPLSQRGRKTQPLSYRIESEKDGNLLTIYQAVSNNTKFFCDSKQEDELIFYEPETNILIKLTHPNNNIEVEEDDDQQHTHADNKTDIDGQNQSKIESQMGKRALYKQYARELLSYDVILDAILFNSSKGKEGSRLRVPLSTMVDYMGFRALAIAYVDIDFIKPVLGFYEGNYQISRKSEKVYQDLRNIGIVLNLKENRNTNSVSNQQYKRIPVSGAIQIFENINLPKEDHKDEDENEVLKGFFVHHFKDLDYDEKTPQNYIMRTSEIFPYDIDPLDSNMDNYHTDKVLRPELVCANEKSLRADIKKKTPPYAEKKNNKGQSIIARPNQAEKDNEDNTDAVDLNLANKFLREMKIPQLVDLLDSLIIIPIDSATLEEAFHIQGVNMRYLGKVAELSKLKHVKDLCITEMLARSLKRIFNQAMSQLIQNNKTRKDDNQRDEDYIDKQIYALSNPQYQPLSQDMQSMNLKNRQYESHQAYKQKQMKQMGDLEAKKTQIDQELHELNKDMKGRVKEWIFDFMNMVFGESEETSIFWEEVLFPELFYHYNFDLNELHKFERNLNALFYALCEQIGLKVTEKNTPPQSPTEAHQRNTSGQGVHNNKKQNQEGKEDYAIYKDFGKHEFPFGTMDNTNTDFKLVPKTRTYKFRNLMYNAIAQKFRDYKNNGCMAEAYETCKMRKHMNMCLKGEDGELSTKLDLCQLQLEDRQWHSAHKMAEKALEELKTRQLRMHAKAIQFQTILMQAHYMANEFQVAEKAFTLALEILDHHWGPYHPLHINIYGIMAQLLILNQKYEDATYLYKASLRCCMRILGPNHIQTGEVHMDYARLQLLKSKKIDEQSSKALQQKNDSLQHFIEAYNIFKNYFNSEQDKLDALQTAEAAIQIAELMEEDTRMNDAFVFAQVASQTYQHVYAQDNPLIIKAMWQELSIAYAIQSPKTEEIAAELFYALAKRDYILSIGDIQTFERHQKQAEKSQLALNASGEGNARQPGKGDLSQKASLRMGRENSSNNGPGNINAEDGSIANRTGRNSGDVMSNAAAAQQIAQDRTNKEINKIKADLIATIIMEKTRNLKNEQKTNIKAFCDKEQFTEMCEREGDFQDKKEDIITNLKDFHYTKLNPLRVISVRKLDFHDRAHQLLQMYNQSVKKINWLVPEDVTELDSRKNLFHEQYDKMIKSVDEKENENRTIQKGQANPVQNQIFDDQSTNLFERTDGNGFNDQQFKVVDDFTADVDLNIFRSYVEGGNNGGYEQENEVTGRFFRRLIKIFKNINFYNLLNLTDAQASKEADQVDVNDQ